jgi:cyclophilin family peptidyl-prolyl cis-trans isomerase
VLAQLAEKYPKQVRVIYRHFPLTSHPLAIPAAQAAEAAGKQGKFWEMHDAIFANQGTWAAMTESQFTEWVTKQAETLGLKKDQFTSDMTSPDVVDKVKQAQEHGAKIGIPGTPFMLLNGQIYQGPRDLGSLEVILNLFEMQKHQITYCPPMVIDPKKAYSATIKTEKGDFVMDLYADKAPLAVNSFVFLARNNWFDNVTFHRVIPDVLVQAGDPSGSGMGGPGYNFADEITDLKFDKAGVVGMANAGPGSNGSQFFITLKELPDLSGKYTIFGQVTSGLDVLKALTARDPSQELGLPPGDKILDVTITEK